MNYRVDLVSHYTIVVDASNEENAITLAEKYVNESPSVRPYFEFEDGGIEETEDEAEITEEELE